MVHLVIHLVNAKCMHLGLPFQGANNFVHVHAIEEVIQNEAVGVNFSVDSQYRFQATSKVRYQVGLHAISLLCLSLI